MQKPYRRDYLTLWVFALAFGWIEAATVTYLRDVYFQHGVGSVFSLGSLPTPSVRIELVREACTLVVLAAAAWLAGRWWATRIGAFLLLFGVWDLVYYAVLRLTVGWPDSLTAWDILFLIPLPWVAPVWAPATIALLFVIAGSYLFLTPDRPRRYTTADAGILLASTLAVLAAFLVPWKPVVNQAVPESFPAWLFWAGVVLATSWFIHVERRSSGGSAASAMERPGTKEHERIAS